MSLTGCCGLKLFTRRRESAKRILLCTVACLSMSGCTSTEPRQVIEKHLGVSLAGARVLDDALPYTDQDDAPDVGLVLYELAKLKQDRNLTVGLLFARAEDDLIGINSRTSTNSAALCRAVLSRNMTAQGTTLVRPQDVTNIVVETNHNGLVIGTFDWSIPEQLSGRCRFVAKGKRLEYLGFFRKDPIHTYDCSTIFSRYGNLEASEMWIQTVYFIVVEPASLRTRALSQADRKKDLRDLFRSSGLKKIRFAYLRDATMPLVCITDREDRKYRIKVIELLTKSDDWKLGLAGRAVFTMDGDMSMEDSIKQQIEKIAGEVSEITLELSPNADFSSPQD